MTKRISLFFGVLSFLFAVCGCQPDGPPQIVGKTKHPTFTSNPAPAPKPSKPYVLPKVGTAPGGWIPPRKCEKGWKAIVIHHSDTKRGSMKTIDLYHRKTKKWKGIGYGFVIGNGNGSGNGQVEVTFRWRQQITGAHCGGTLNNWANEDGIGICLIGDFTKTVPTYRQMDSLVKLVRFLQDRYKIPKSRIYGHRTTPGYKNGTKCPGKYFPMTKLKKML
jgi:hypothetical protein